MIPVKVSLPFVDYLPHMRGITVSSAYDRVERTTPILLAEADIPLPPRGPGLHRLVQEIMRDVIEYSASKNVPWRRRRFPVCSEQNDFFVTVGYLDFDNETDLVLYKMKHGERFKIDLV